MPKEEVEKSGADFGHHPVGTGAYKLDRMDARPAPRARAQPGLLSPGVPYLDKITFEIGQEPLVALLRLQKGEVDVLGDGIPPAKFLEVMDDPAGED